MNVRKICIILLFFCISATMVFSQDNRPIEFIGTETIQSFDDEITDWTVKSSKSASDQLLGIPTVFESRSVEAWPRELFGSEGSTTPEGETRRVLGVNVRFQQRGYNYIEVIAPNESLDLPGFVQEIHLWVWNARRNHSVTVHLQDYRGIYHTLEMGTVGYLGWERLSVRIPGYVSQLSESQRIHDDVDNLRLVKFVVWTDPLERVDDFQLYFDELRVLSNTSEPLIDGSELAAPDFIEREWGAGQ